MRLPGWLIAAAGLAVSAAAIDYRLGEAFGYPGSVFLEMLVVGLGITLGGIGLAPASSPVRWGSTRGC